MIFGNIQNLKEYAFLPQALQDCFTYAASHDLLELDAGTYEIDQKRLFVNITQYTTTAPKNRVWEAHRQYLDLHLMLRGTEMINVNFIENMKQLAYQQDKDFLPLEGICNSSVVLQEGDFLICYPNDCHQTALQVSEPETIKKAIFKNKYDTNAQVRL